MHKEEFLVRLQKELAGLPEDDVVECISFYDEMIEDRMEEGMSEEDAVESIDSLDKIVLQTIENIPITKIAKERIKPKRRLKVWEIVLIVLGSPIWISLGISAIAVIFSVYISLWSVIVSLWSVFGALVGSAFAGITSGIVFVCTENVPAGIVMMGLGVACVGLSIFMFYGCKMATKGILILTKKFAVWLKNCFVKREVAS